MTENIRKLRENREEFEKKPSLARRRLSMLFDGGKFTEINTFMTSNPDLASDGILCGYGEIAGTPVFAYAQDPDILGGAFGEIHGKKIQSLYRKACRLGMPIIALLDSQGIRLDEGISGFSVLGGICAEMCRASGVIPQIALIPGNAMGSMTLIPALSDFAFALNNSKVFMSSPETKAVSSGNKDAKTIIGKKFDSEGEMFDFARNLMSFLPKNNAEGNFSNWNRDSAYISELNENLYKTKDILTLISDGNLFAEVFESSAINLGFSRFGGQCAAAVGFSGLEADAQSLDKLEEFISFADAFSIPIVTLTNLSSLSQKDSDESIIKSSAKLIRAFTKASVPKINVITEKLIGAPLLFANSPMTGADMVYVWADAQIGLMDSEGAVNVMEAADFTGSKDIESLKNRKMTEYRKTKLDPFETARTGLADDIIEPAETRAAIISALSLLYTKAEKALPYKKHSAKKI